MNKTTLEELIADDPHELLNIDKKGIYRIYGRIKGKKGGTFFGFTENEGGEPVFGGANLMHAPTWWNHSFREISEICNEITARYPNCEATPNKCG